MLMKNKNYNAVPDKDEVAFWENQENQEKMADTSDSDFDPQEDQEKPDPIDEKLQGIIDDPLEKNANEHPLQDTTKEDDGQGGSNGGSNLKQKPSRQQHIGSPVFNSSYGATEAIINGVSGLIGGTLLGAGKGLIKQGKKLVLYGMNTARAINNINPVEHLSAWRQNIAKKEHSLLETRVERIGRFLDEIGDDSVMKDVSQKLSDGQFDFQDAKDEISGRLKSDDPNLSESSFNKNYQAMMEEIKAMKNNDWLGTQERMRRANDQTALAMAGTQEKFELILENPVLDKLPDESKDHLENIKKNIQELMAKIREFFSKVFGVYAHNESSRPSM